MKYAVWFVRLVFATWMIPAGINHFYPLFPQPMGSQPESHELIVALLDSHLFDIVKVVELVAGIAVLIGYFAPLALLLCMPVSFCVFFWDAPLEGYGSIAAIYGYSVLGCNLLLCLAYLRSYTSLLTVRAVPNVSNVKAVTLARLLLGALLLLTGLNHFWLGLWMEPVGSQPLAVQLMEAFQHSGLMGVAMAIELAAGALLLAGLCVPLALCVVMPVSVCALYWAVVLDHGLHLSVAAMAALALNGLLMLAYLPNYRGALQQRATTLGEV